MKNHDKSKAIKVKLYKNKLKSADKAPYLGRVVSKGKATLEVVLAGEELDTYRFTASRKVTVR